MGNKLLMLNDYFPVDTIKQLHSSSLIDFRTKFSFFFQHRYICFSSRKLTCMVLFAGGLGRYVFSRLRLLVLLRS